MNKCNTDAAWQLLISRKAKRPAESRIAFLAALLMERCSGNEIGGPPGMRPHIAEAFAAELVRLAGRIKRLAEQACNEELTPAQEAQSERLQKRFGDIAAALGFDAETGGDPRGACAYLIDPDNRREGDGWGTGWAVYS